MSAPAPRRQDSLGRTRHVHMVGIGGIGMSSIAEVLIARGYTVTGSDLRRSETTERLESLGAKVYEGHAARQVEGADVVVYSSAVKPDQNAETKEAERQRVPLIRRADMLAELMRMKYGVGIAGTHGKTTTTTMVGLVVGQHDLDPTIIVGGKVASFGATNAVSGEGDLIIVEADEYDRTFLRLTPVLAVVTNIEADHLDIYDGIEDIKGAFTEFANSVPFFGAAILCIDSPTVREVIRQIGRRVVTYGLSRQATIRAEHVRQEGPVTRFQVVRETELLGEIALQAPGLHNVRNALAAVAVGLELEIPFETISSGLGAFTGVERRFQMKGEAGGILVVDDYAHHPTEIEATLEGASNGWPDRRVVAVFQPHLYSRTRDFQHDFARSFFNADVLVFTDVYPAREEPIPGVDGRLLAQLATRYGHRNTHYVEDKADLPDYLATLCEEGDLVVTMGAGDVYRSGERFLERLADDSSSEPD